uniref:Uncharacterized protein n=1 Tax=viral metagenome TaxID=1070528 RepID=A0A6H1ZNP4_9ZZZZ
MKQSLDAPKPKQLQSNYLINKGGEGIKPSKDKNSKNIFKLQAFSEPRKAHLQPVAPHSRAKGPNGKVKSNKIYIKLLKKLLREKYIVNHRVLVFEDMEKLIKKSNCQCEVCKLIKKQLF